MPKKNEHEYTKTHLTQISTIYKDDNLYNSLYMAFYNGANKSQQKGAEELRQSTITLTDALLQEGKTVISPELSQLIMDYQNQSPTALSDTTRIQENQKQITNKLKAAVKVTDKLVTVLPYTQPGTNSYSFANPTITKNPRSEDAKKQNEESAKIAAIFSSFTAYNGMAKKVLNKDYQYSTVEKQAISNVLGNIPKDTDLNKEEIHEKLTENYLAITNLDFVQATDRTNYLKSSGFHAKDFGVSGIILGGMLAVSFASTLFGAPLDGGNISAWMMHIGNQAALLGITAGIGLGGNGLRQYFVNKNFNKPDGVRDQVRQVLDKKQFFENVKNAEKAKDFELKNGMDLGRGKSAKLAYLKEAANKELTFGARKADIKKYNKQSQKTLQTARNEKYITEQKQVLGLELSATNPMAIILDIEGVKTSRRKTTVAQTYTPVNTRESTPIRSTVAAKRDSVAEEKQEKNRSNSNSSKVKSILSDTENKSDYVTIKPAKIDAMFKRKAIDIHIAKLDVAKAKNEAEIILTKIMTKADELSKDKDFKNSSKFDYNEAVSVTYSPSTKAPKTKNK